MKKKIQVRQLQDKDVIQLVTSKYSRSGAFDRHMGGSQTRLYFPDVHLAHPLAGVPDSLALSPSHACISLRTSHTDMPPPGALLETRSRQRLPQRTLDNFMSKVLEFR